MRKIVFESSAFEDYNNWIKSDKQIHGKIVQLIKDINRSPFSGIGKPEPLRHELSGYWSRRIAVASDDQRFLKKLEAADIPYLTPSACITFLYKNSAVVKTEALDMIERLKLFISRDRISRGHMPMPSEGKSGN